MTRTEFDTHNEQKHSKWSVTTAIKNVGKMIILSFLLLIIYAFSAAIVGLNHSSMTTDFVATMTGTVLMVLSYTIVLSYPIIRSKWFGLRLILAISAAYYGLAIFLPQLDVILFLSYFENIVDASLATRVLLQGAITAVIFIPLAVLLFKKMRSKQQVEPNQSRSISMSKRQWVIKLIMIAGSYIILYIAAGTLIAWQNPELTIYYGDLIDQMSAVGTWMLLFQGVRAIIFTAIAFPIIRLMKGNWWEAGLTVALLLSVLMSTPMLIPTNFMPDSVRMSHFVELFTENFVLGWIIVGLLRHPHRLSGDDGVERRISRMRESQILAPFYPFAR